MERPKLTFVHGFMGDPSDWDFIASELSDYEICTPHLKPAADWDASVEQLIADMPERSVIVGYSMGARLSLAAALTKPEVCEGLVFVSGNPGLEDETTREKRYGGDCRIAELIDKEPRRQFLHHWYTQSTVFKSLEERVRNDEIERKAARSGDDWGAILRTNSVAKQPNYWPRLSEIEVPMTAIAGLLDRKYANIIARMGMEPNIETRVVPHCGHIVHREQPHVFLYLIREYLAAISEGLSKVS